MSDILRFFERLEVETGPDGNWMIERDEHRVNYETVAEMIDHNDHFAWESETEKARAIQQNRIITLHWYQQTPIGSYKLAASNLEALARFVLAARF